ncbi:flavodoxin [Aminipila butyrica]|uniref:Flavodoxin n=1 Tax=Aminipila butyrica TaxID=433296 RepID=A0A858BZV7_9FIRM|nr:flavodoxin [Aminipila butyrica]QIB70314.1 flavodoxin [Aminipila butyrica]
MKSIVVFYSLEGNCKLIGQTIAKATGADVLELKLEKPVPDKGPLKYISGGHSALKKMTPKLAEPVPNLSDYELIFVGAPVWAGTFAPALRTFAAKAHLENKLMCFFTCCGGGSTEKCLADMKALFEGNTFLSEIQFVNPASKNREACILKTQSWIENLSVTLSPQEGN